MTKYRVTDENGKEVQHGDTVLDFREREWTFEVATRAPQPGRSAKVEVSDGAGQHREFYLQVFPGLTIEKAEQ